MTILIVRHTHAGNRGTWKGRDTFRPVSLVGRKQAKKLVKVLKPYAIDRILSSPYDRCVQSVLPLAHKRGLGVEPHSALAETATADEVAELMWEVIAEDVVLCSHGDIIPKMLDVLQQEGVDLGSRIQWEKASTWVVQTKRKKRTFETATYLPPPKV